jgi:HEAT repeat protein
MAGSFFRIGAGFAANRLRRKSRVIALGVLLVSGAGANSGWAAPPIGVGAGAARLEVAPVADGSLALREGGRVLAAISLRTPARLRGTPTVKEVAVEGRRVAVVRVPSHEKSTSEAWVGLLENGAARALWTGTLGAQDADGEIHLVLEVEPAGIVLYESAARVTQCDGTPVRIAARRFDFERGGFQPLAAALPAPGAQKLVAHRGPGRARRPRVSFAFSSASAPPADAPGDDARALVAPLTLSDGDLETAWVEKGGPRGTGGVLTARAAGSGFAVSELQLLPGDVRSNEAFATHGRARAVTLVLGPAPEQRFEVVLDETGSHDRRRPFVITLPRPVPTSCVSLQVREVIAGRGSAATVAWTEATVFTDLDGGDGASRLVEDLAGPNCAARLGDVPTLGAGAGPKLVAALGASTGNGPGRECLLEALQRLATPPPLDAETSAAFVKQLPKVVAEVSTTEEALLLRVLKVLPAPPVAELGALLADGKADEATRQRAARALLALNHDDARARLVRAVGTGSPGLRAELRRLTAAQPGAVPRLAEALGATAPTEVTRRADLAFALGAAARAQGNTGEAGVLLRDLAADPGGAFEVRARAVQALGALGVRGDAPALEALEHLAKESKDPPLRLLATRGLGAGGRESAARVTPALRRAVGDSDPAVRAAAAEALGALGDKGATAGLVAGAKQEPWPMVRRAEIEALGRLCGGEATDLLARAVERDNLETVDIRMSAMRGLFTCHDQRALELGLAVLDRETETPAMRTEAALCLGRTGKHELNDDLGASLRRLMVEAQADQALEGVAFATLNAMATLGGPTALDAALVMRADPRPAFRRAAAQALGQLCAGAEPARERASAALRESVHDSDEAVAGAARAALRRCPLPARPTTTTMKR